MAADLIITPEARDDLDDAYEWYETKASGKGEDFLDKVDVCLSEILVSPELQAVCFANYRQALLRKFPYTVIYEYQHEVVTIYGVFHTSRDEQNWRDRLP